MKAVTTPRLEGSESQPKRQQTPCFLPLYENNISIANAFAGALGKGDERSRRAAESPYPSPQQKAAAGPRERSGAQGHLPGPCHRLRPPVRFPGSPVQALPPNNAEELNAF